MTANYCPKCLTSFADDPVTCPNLGCRHERPGPGWGQVLGQGDLLDRHYRILRVLAVGGMGITYQAREVDAAQNSTGPDLAIKVLFPQRDTGPFLRRLANEAQILQDLAHPHIVECRGFVQRSGHAPYLVTRFEGGGTLGAHVTRVGTLSPDVAAGVLDQILEALQVAHDKGIVHRDLKPDNVLLGKQTLARDVPWVRVADFGIAKVFVSPAGLTRLGTFLGTPEYAAPEQFDGLPPSPATDVWAAGALAYHLLVGRPPVEFSHRADIESDREELLKQVPPKLPADILPVEARDRLQVLLDHTMVPTPTDRWTVQQVRVHLATVPPAPRPKAPPPVEDKPTLMPPKEAAPATVWEPNTPPPAPTASRSEPASKSETPHAAPTLPQPGPTLTPRDAPKKPPPPPRTEPTELPTASGVGAGVLGVGAIVFLGSMLAAIVLGAAAWGFGWFAPAAEVGTPVVLDPIEVTSAMPTPVDPDPAEKTALEAALKVAAADLALLCKPKGTVPVRVVVEPDGRVRSAAADPRAMVRDPTGVACVEKAVAKMTLPRSGKAPVGVTVSLAFGP